MSIKPTVNLVQGGPGGAAILAGLKSLSSKQVYVGIPEKTTGRKSKGITNAQLAFVHTMGVQDSSMRRIIGAKMLKGHTYGTALAMYLHTHGSALNQIPPRPIIEPAIEANRAAIEKELAKAAEAALAGNAMDVDKYLNRAGMMAQNFVRAWFTDSRNGWAPNSPSTIKRKGSSQPLVGTGQLRKSITYVVAK